MPRPTSALSRTSHCGEWPPIRPEYWIIDPVEESVLLLTLVQGDDEYQESGVFHRGDRFASLEVEGFEVDVTTLFVRETASSHPDFQ